MCRKRRLRQERQKNKDKLSGACSEKLYALLFNSSFVKKIWFILYFDINGAIIALL